jgi:hypothetical protein
MDKSGAMGQQIWINQGQWVSKYGKIRGNGSANMDKSGAMGQQIWINQGQWVSIYG